MMKYNINLNQKALKELSPDIDLAEAVILDYLVMICSSMHEEIEKQRVEGYTWIDYKNLLRELPILKGKTAGTITPKMKNLEEYGYIATLDKKDERTGHNKKYVKLTAQCDALEREQPSLFRNLNKPIEKTKGAHLENSINYNISDSNIKDSINIIYELYKEKICKTSRLVDKARDKIKARLKNFTLEELKESIDKFAAESWWMEHNAQRGVAWFFHCLDKETPLIIKNIKSGEISLCSISWLYGTRINDFLVWSGLKFVKINNLIKHRANNLYRYRSFGGEVVSTENHKYFLNNSIEVLGKDLKVGSKLLTGEYPSLPVNYNIDNDFAWVLGLFAAEGSAGENYWSISNKNIKLLERAKTILGRFGMECIVANYKSNHGVYVLKVFKNMKQWAKIYENWFYNKLARNRMRKLKKIPDFMFSASINAKKMFFNGYYLGDGVSAKIARNRYYSFTTNSPLLCQGLLMIYNQIYGTGFTLTNKTNVDAFMVYLKSADKSKPKPKEKELGEVSWIEKKKSYTRFVYDIAVDEQKVMAGVGIIISHNSDARIDQFLNFKGKSGFKKTGKYDHLINEERVS